jgi:hypothetical protein
VTPAFTHISFLSGVTRCDGLVFLDAEVAEITREARKAFLRARCATFAYSALESFFVGLAS